MTTRSRTAHRAPRTAHRAPRTAHRAPRTAHRAHRAHRALTVGSHQHGKFERLRGHGRGQQRAHHPTLAEANHASEGPLLLHHLDQPLQTLLPPCNIPAVGGPHVRCPNIIEPAQLALRRSIRCDELRRAGPRRIRENELGAWYGGAR
jgi:hypothetical protein